MMKEEAPRLLSQEFLDKYPSHPEHMTPMGSFVFYRTYSRFLPEERRRESWKETVARAVEHNVSLDYKHRTKIGLTPNMGWLKQEAESLFDNIFNLRQFLSGELFCPFDKRLSSKTLLIAGTL